MPALNPARLPLDRSAAVALSAAPFSCMNPPALDVLPYHLEIRDYLKSQEAELWRWFSSVRARENFAEELRLGLLKSTYRLSVDHHPEIHGQFTAAARALDLPIALHLYQSQSGNGSPNASIYTLPGEAHVVLSGPITTLLNAEEMVAVFGHELAHYLLWTLDEGDHLVADRVLHAAIEAGGAHSTHHETARRYRLHTEIFADRGSARATQSLLPAVSALVKLETGLATVNGESYLAQAAEIFAGGNAVTSGQLSHPECFIRAHALALWHEQGPAANAAITALIAGAPDLAALDLPAQHQLTALTRRFLAQLLRPRWFQSDATLAHARLFFPDFTPAADDDPTLPAELKATGAIAADYFAWLLLDFIHVDPDLNDAPTAAALQWADRLGLAPHLENLLIKELGLPPRDLARLKPQVATLLQQAEAGA